MNTNALASRKSQINEEIACLRISVEEIDKNLDVLCIKLLGVLKDRTATQDVLSSEVDKSISNIVPLAEEIKSIKLDVVKANNKIRSIVSSCEL